MPCGAFRPESTDTVRVACPVCLASGNASTVPSLISVTSSTPPGLNAICRACGAWAKTEIRKPGGSLRRLKSSFSTRMQESKSKQNTTETRVRQQVTGRSEAWGTYLTGAAVVTGLNAIFCSRWHTQFLYQNRQNYPARCFFAYAFRVVAFTMCCWLKTYAGRSLAFDL